MPVVGECVVDDSCLTATDLCFKQMCLIGEFYPTMMLTINSLTCVPLSRELLCECLCTWGVGWRVGTGGKV